ncbi:putative transcription activator protein [Thermochaetoides thermophila DSM 1495]|uniref:Putative transcription activator protein n=1 Tax=Chaetomium thermophilum (strain DSM 1495 / CBS 144.50 / IMI 039719) TaxID=759272 RepID=G0S060_CHATD|nr:putative transcription activator protein [Thermochaetoides thermophila DSM 1495]EGS23221.1 putative transcription activator protein [Thermochaetoides thermophila DSM 1495]
MTLRHPNCLSSPPQHPTSHLQSAVHSQPASPFVPDLNALDLPPYDHDIDTDFSYSSLSSSPVSTYSQPSQISGVGSSPLSAFETVPTPTFPVPRPACEGPLFESYQQSSHFSPEPSVPLFSGIDAMQTETWLPNGSQLTPRSVSNFSHHRDSSRSSMASDSPLSPYPHSLSNPQIAVSDAVTDGFHAMSPADDLNYQLTPKSFSGVTHDSFYTTLPATYGPAATSGITSYPYCAAVPKRRHDLLPPHPEHPIGASRSQPVSVASSIASGSPATPNVDIEEDRRPASSSDNNNVNTSASNSSNSGEITSVSQDLFAPGSSISDLEMSDNTAMPTIPKLDRTISDVYTDELYSPNFTITSSTSSGQIPVSPTAGIFAQRLQAANSQHLSAVAHSPVSATSREQSPFRQGSPLAPLPVYDFQPALGSAHMPFGSAQKMREQTKAIQDARALQQQIVRATAGTSTPPTISPKDALIELPQSEAEANFPLFPQQAANAGFPSDMISKAAATAVTSQPTFGGLSSLDPSGFGNYLTTQLPPAPNVPVHPQYAFMTQQRQQTSAVPSIEGSMPTTRLGSADTAATDSAQGGATPARPDDTSADSGTYSCTYHGCPYRFATPALLQKHKREGHRQAHGLGARRPDGTPAGLFNTQAGPHRCDRINPSTGKPCNTVFSRPYDLTRHEDTIHNARKQKVRCDLCTDEKTFSRADALTRHYRVCHPDVEFPGKHRRRGGHSSHSG